MEIFHYYTSFHLNFQYSLYLNRIYGLSAEQQRNDCGFRAGLKRIMYQLHGTGIKVTLYEDIGYIIWGCRLYDISIDSPNIEESDGREDGKRYGHWG